MLRILTTYHCAKCKEVKKRLTQKNISFLECPADDPSGIELVVKHRVMTAPSLFITEEKENEPEAVRIITDFDEILLYIERLTAQ